MNNDISNRHGKVDIRIYVYIHRERETYIHIWNNNNNQKEAMNLIGSWEMEELEGGDEGR